MKRRSPSSKDGETGEERPFRDEAALPRDCAGAHLHSILVLMKMSLAKEAPAVPGQQPGKKALLVFFETDCPTCQLALPYLNALAGSGAQVIGLSQDDEPRTHEFVRQMAIAYPVVLDHGLELSRAYD